MQTLDRKQTNLRFIPSELIKHVQEKIWRVICVSLLTEWKQRQEVIMLVSQNLALRWLSLPAFVLPACTQTSNKQKGCLQSAPMILHVRLNDQ